MATPLADQDLLSRLVAFDTTSHRPNAPLAEWIADYLDRPGLSVTLQDGEDSGKVNLVARTGPGAEDAPAVREKGREEVHGGMDGLTLCGHLDVVPATEPGWRSDPFRLEERDGLLFGRGTADMKGFCALAVNRLVHAADRRLRHPLGLLLTYDEEVGSLGARHFVRHRPPGPPLPGEALVGEPTSLRPIRMHKGHMRIRILLRGRPAHSGSPHLGVNAVEGAGPVLVALGELRRRLEREPSLHARHFPDAPFPVLSIVGIEGGRAWNVIPDGCEIRVGLRSMPGGDPDRGLDRIRSAVRSIQGSDGPEVRATGNSPPLLTPEDVRLHRLLCDLTGKAEAPGATFASDAGWLSTAGYQCVLFGPGSIEVAHRADEHLPVSEFHRAGRYLDELIRRMCE